MYKKRRYSPSQPAKSASATAHGAPRRRVRSVAQPPQRIGRPRPFRPVGMETDSQQAVHRRTALNRSPLTDGLNARRRLRWRAEQSRHNALKPMDSANRKHAWMLRPRARVGPAVDWCRLAAVTSERCLRIDKCDAPNACAGVLQLTAANANGTADVAQVSRACCPLFVREWKRPFC